MIARERTVTCAVSGNGRDGTGGQRHCQSGCGHAKACVSLRAGTYGTAAGTQMNLPAPERSEIRGRPWHPKHDRYAAAVPATGTGRKRPLVC